MCAIVGITGREDAGARVHQGLQILQHRGQDSAGITTSDAGATRLHTHKQMGRVSQVFSNRELALLRGDTAIGHTRYSTIGSTKESDIQPMTINFPYAISMVHNGNLSNFQELKAELSLGKSFFTSDNDLEIMLHLLAQNLKPENGETFFDQLSRSVSQLLEKAQGGYSVIATIGGEGLIAFRDRHGIRPLTYGVKRMANNKMSYCFSSETSVLSALDYMIIGEVAPGELCFVNDEGELFKKSLTTDRSLPCMFEWIYFSGAESLIGNKSVYETRLSLGRALANKIKRESLEGTFDLVVPVPDTSRPAAIALSEVLNLPYREALVKNRYVYRSFIENGQEKRDKTVNLKFHVIAQQVEGKSVILVDDSIVRGTTSSKIIKLLREHGAKKVFLASTCPPIIHPCFYGIDFPTSKELVAFDKNHDEIVTALNADGVFYNDHESLKTALEIQSFCQACLDGAYPYKHKSVQYAKSQPCL